MYCDSCIQELGLKWRQQVQLITSTLSITKSFKRDVARCCNCHETPQVTRAEEAAPARRPRVVAKRRQPLESSG
jgi:hypothetical protein